ncbi:MAG: Crp/Fnr family transcriptional regulator [Burkholderiales bacterium]|nr:Crp/Fnr family transcriptional regulator [Burkholderiales bacterium]
MIFSENGLVAQLAASDQALLRRRCTMVELTVGDLLQGAEADRKVAYFLTGATVALCVRQGESGAGDASLALGLAGFEGAVGVQYGVGIDAGIFSSWVQTAGPAWCIDGLELQQLVARRPPMLLLFSRYVWTVLQDVAALAACAQLHDIKSRLASWILMSELRSRGGELMLTHTHLAQMLGVRRAGVTTAALELKRQGLIDYQRGSLRIVDRGGLEAVSCWLPDRKRVDST